VRQRIRVSKLFVLEYCPRWLLTVVTRFEHGRAVKQQSPAVEACQSEANTNCITAVHHRGSGMKMFAYFALYRDPERGTYDIACFTPPPRRCRLLFQGQRHLEAGRASVCLANRSIASSTSKQVEKPSRAIDATKRAVNCSPRFSSDGVDQRVE
jgi:hypothetical protein